MTCLQKVKLPVNSHDNLISRDCNQQVKKKNYGDAGIWHLQGNSCMSLKSWVQSIKSRSVQSDTLNLYAVYSINSMTLLFLMNWNCIFSAILRAVRDGYANVLHLCFNGFSCHFSVYRSWENVNHCGHDDPLITPNNNLKCPHFCTRCYWLTEIQFAKATFTS